MKKFSETSPNQFFKNNALRPVPRATSYSAFTHTTKRSEPEKQIKSSVKINPKKFMHREVFNTKLYQQSVGESHNVRQHSEKNMKKFFQISVTKKQRIDGQLGDEEGQFISEATQFLSEKKYYSNSQLQKSWKAMLHHFLIIDKLLRFVDPKDPFKMTLKTINEHLQQFLSTFFNQYDKITRKLHEINLNITNLSRDPFSNTVTNNFMNNKSIVQNNSMSIKYENQSMLKTQKQKINGLEFQNKKLILLCEKLQEDLKSKATELDASEQMCRKLREGFKESEKERANYEFKIKKLKEELEVAHIIKEQNLADKVNYILGWNL